MSKIPVPKNPFEDSFQAADWIRQVMAEALTVRPSALNLRTSCATEEFRDDHIHVTELVGECLCKAAYRLQEVASGTVVEQDLQHWSHEGFMKEEWVRAVFRRAYPRGFLSSGQVPVPASLKGCFKIQGFYDLFSPKLRVVVDVKSKDLSVCQKGDMVDKDALQVAAYAAMLSEEKGYPIHACLVYVPRQDISALTVHPVVVDNGVMLDYLMVSADMIMDIKAGGVEAESEARTELDGEGFPCRWTGRSGPIQCRHYTRCWSSKKVVEPEVPTGDMEHLLVEAHRLRLAKKEAETKVKAVSEELKQVEDRIKPVMEKSGTPYALPGVGVVKLTTVKDQTAPDVDLAMSEVPDLKEMLAPYRVKYDLALAEKCNPRLREVLASYRKVTRKGYSYLTWPREKSDAGE